MKLKLGIIGTSWISEKAVEAAFLQNNYCLETIYSRKLETAQLFAKKNKILKATSDFNDLFKMDVVYVGSPNKLHFAHCKKLLENKVNVICEKPLTPGNYSEALELNKLAKSNNVYLFEAIKVIFTPNFLKLKRIISSSANKIASFSYCQTSSKILNNSYETSSTFLRSMGGGVHNDLGIYPIRIIVELFGIPEKILATGTDMINDCFQTVLITFKYKNKKEISIIISKIKNSNQGGIFINQNDYITFDSCSTITNIFLNRESIPLEQLDNDMFYEFDEFFQIIFSKNNEKHETLMKNSLKCSKILEIIEQELYN